VKEGVAVIAVHGVGNLAKWWRFFTCYGIPVYPIFDNDAKDEERSLRRVDLLGTLAVSDDEARTLLTTKKWKITPRISVFGVNFEVTLRLLFGEEYEFLESQAADVYGLSHAASKPLVGRYVAERLSFDEKQVGWSLFRALAVSIQDVT
jgi:putative ATP-dependent endonuclease of OLD family